MLNYIKNIILLSFLIFLSCDKDGTIVHNEPLIHQSSVDGTDYSIPNQDIALDGNGCSGDNLCYEVDDVYYDFSNSNGFEFDYYKFNYCFRYQAIRKKCESSKQCSANSISFRVDRLQDYSAHKAGRFTGVAEGNV